MAIYSAPERHDERTLREKREIPNGLPPCTDGFFFRTMARKTALSLLKTPNMPERRPDIGYHRRKQDLLLGTTIYQANLKSSKDTTTQ